MKSRRRNRGSALVEFGMVAVVLYLLVAGGIELGRLIFVAQSLQDAARIAARELSVASLPADTTFEAAITQIFDEDRVVIDVDKLSTADCGNLDLEGYFSSLPLLNRTLRSVYISDVVIDSGGNQRRLLRYPGALVVKAGLDPCTSGFTVRIPRVVPPRGANGLETIQWIPVVTEVREKPYDPSCAAWGPFPVSTQGPSPTCGDDTSVTKGIVSLVINYPFQAAALSGFQRNGGGTADPNLDNPIVADDDNVDVVGPDGTTPAAAREPSDTSFSGAQSSAVLNPDGSPAAPAPGPGPYSGDFGLGRQYALNKNVRPYRSLLSGQAIFRREVME